jgi:glutathione S-transferase
MSDLTLVTFDWVPDAPRGFVRDLRVRWALEEAGLPYRVASTSFSDRKPEHFAHQPFGQVPWLTDGDLSIFESGAILLHLGELSSTLMPVEARGRSDVKEWLFAAFASVEAASQPWSFFEFSGDTDETPMRKFFDGFLEARLTHMEAVLEGRDWLVGSFSIADIMMADVLRLVDRFGGLADYPVCRAYVGRAKARPAFAKAHADQLAHFAKADPAPAAT